MARELERALEERDRLREQLSGLVQLLRNWHRCSCKHCVDQDHKRCPELVKLGAVELAALDPEPAWVAKDPNFKLVDRVYADKVECVWRVISVDTSGRGDVARLRGLTPGRARNVLVIKLLRDYREVPRVA